MFDIALWRLHFAQFLVIPILLVEGALQQDPLPRKPANKQERLLELRQAQLAAEQAEVRFQSKTRLFQENLISESDLSDAEFVLLQAQTSYQQSFLAMIPNEPRLTVISAVKSVTNDGYKAVRLTIENTSDPYLDYRELGLLSSTLSMPDVPGIRELQNLLITLKDSEGVIVSRPYQRKVQTLVVGEQHAVSFVLLRDVDPVIVGLSYAGKEDEIAVYLERDPSADIVTLQSEQFSKEAELGTQASYELQLERFSAGADVVKLQVLNLPARIETALYASSNDESRLNLISFTEDQTTKEITLKLFLPESSEQVVIDEAIRFWVLAIDPKESGRFSTEVRYSAEQINAIKSGKVPLEIIPRGVGRLEVRVSNLFRSIDQGESLTLPVNIKNIGTRTLNNIVVSTETPQDWTSQTFPPSIDRLYVNAEQRVRVQLNPPRSVTLGDYAVKIRTEAYSLNELVLSEDKVARIKITAPSSLFQTAAIAAILVGVLVLVGIVGLKITKR